MYFIVLMILQAIWIGLALGLASSLFAGLTIAPLTWLFLSLAIASLQTMISMVLLFQVPHLVTALLGMIADSASSNGMGKVRQIVQYWSIWLASNLLSYISVLGVLALANQLGLGISFPSLGSLLWTALISQWLPQYPQEDVNKPLKKLPLTLGSLVAIIIQMAALAIAPLVISSARHLTFAGIQVNFGLAVIAYGVYLVIIAIYRSLFKLVQVTWQMLGMSNKLENLPSEMQVAVGLASLIFSFGMLIFEVWLILQCFPS
ncbi:MAG: hypothetical protein HC925_01390, partial [Coleofasciculaceae cyanobacterium SM2_3_26]|nr:hypothetical protein [Coleofasciculaceae cyanobacterium SM2_3_26]